MVENKQMLSNVPHSLAGITLLGEAGPHMLKRIEDMCEWLEFDTDEVVIDLADTSTNVYFVVVGRLKAMDYMDEEKEVSLAELRPGDSFGELAAIDSKKRSARVSALEPTMLASLGGKEFRQILIMCPEVSLVLLKRFASFIRSLTTRVTSLSTMTPRQRVYFELLRISEPNTEGDGSWIIPNIPAHAEIASWVGAEKGIVADAIGNLARDGVVARRHKSLLIKDHARLIRLADAQ